MSLAEPLLIGDARIDRLIDLERFELPLGWLFPDATVEALTDDLAWLEPDFLTGDKAILAIQSTVLRVGGRTILIDTCVGEHKPRPRHPAWNARQQTGYLDRLKALGVAPEAVDIVFCTHLHADHVGWNTRIDNGRWVPTFPNARYLIGKRELSDWETKLQSAPADMINHGSYADSILPVIEARRAELIDHDHQVLDGLVVRRLPGHTPGSIGLSMHRHGGRCLFTGDSIHHPVQLIHPEWSSSLCSDPQLARATRTHYLAEAVENGTWLVPAHFVGHTGVQIRRHGNGYRPNLGNCRPAASRLP